MRVDLPPGLSREFGYTVSYAANQDMQTTVDKLSKVAQDNNLKAYFQVAPEGIRCDYASYEVREKFAQAWMEAIQKSRPQPITIKSPPLSPYLQ